MSIRMLTSGGRPRPGAVRLGRGPVRVGRATPRFSRGAERELKSARCGRGRKQRPRTRHEPRGEPRRPRREARQCSFDCPGFSPVSWETRALTRFRTIPERHEMRYARIRRRPRTGETTPKRSRGGAEGANPPRQPLRPLGPYGRDTSGKRASPQCRGETPPTVQARFAGRSSQASASRALTEGEASTSARSAVCPVRDARDE